MDLSKIFLKDACPTPVGGQAVMEGIMMRGLERTAVAVRLPDGKIHMKTQPNKKMGKWTRIPIVRGVVSFVTSLVQGTGILMYSADVLEANCTRSGMRSRPKCASFSVKWKSSSSFGPRGPTLSVL